MGLSVSRFNPNGKECTVTQVVVAIKEELDQTMWDLAGPLSPMRKPDAEKDWLTINQNGKCNREVLIPEHVASVMRIRIQDWLECDLADYAAFSLCQLTGGNCAAGFVGDEQHVPTDCPFSVVKDEITGKHCCCYTVLADGVCVMDLLDIISSYLDGDGPAPRRHGLFRKWARAMLNFYKAQVHESFLGKKGGDVDGGTPV